MRNYLSQSRDLLCINTKINTKGKLKGLSYTVCLQFVAFPPHSLNRQTSLDVVSALLLGEKTQGEELEEGVGFHDRKRPCGAGRCVCVASRREDSRERSHEQRNGSDKAEAYQKLLLEI